MIHYNLMLHSTTYTHTEVVFLKSAKKYQSFLRGNHHENQKCHLSNTDKYDSTIINIRKSDRHKKLFSTEHVCVT